MRRAHGAAGTAAAVLARRFGRARFGRARITFSTLQPETGGVGCFQTGQPYICMKNILLEVFSFDPSCVPLDLYNLSKKNLKLYVWPFLSVN